MKKRGDLAREMGAKKFQVKERRQSAHEPKNHFKGGAQFFTGHILKLTLSSIHGVLHGPEIFFFQRKKEHCDTILEWVAMGSLASELNKNTADVVSGIAAS